jgi:hypothetical protein
MDLLATYTHVSELQAITRPPIISTIHKSLQHPLSIFQPAVSLPAVPWQRLLTVENASEDGGGIHLRNTVKISTIRHQPPRFMPWMCWHKYVSYSAPENGGRIHHLNAAKILHIYGTLFKTQEQNQHKRQISLKAYNQQEPNHI